MAAPRMRALVSESACACNDEAKKAAVTAGKAIMFESLSPTHRLVLFLPLEAPPHGGRPAGAQAREADAWVYNNMPNELMFLAIQNPLLGAFHRTGSPMTKGRWHESSVRDSLHF